MRERLVIFDAAYDRRHPDPSKNYGIHGVTLRMLLRGPEGVAQFVLFTNWHVPVVQAELATQPSDHVLCQPMPADIGFHALRPQYAGQDQRECEYTATGFCYYDGSSLRAQAVYELLVTEGSEAVWMYLDTYYTQLCAKDQGYASQ